MLAVGADDLAVPARFGPDAVSGLSGVLALLAAPSAEGRAAGRMLTEARPHPWASTPLVDVPPHWCTAADGWVAVVRGWGLDPTTVVGLAATGLSAGAGDARLSTMCELLTSATTDLHLP